MLGDTQVAYPSCHKCVSGFWKRLKLPEVECPIFYMPHAFGKQQFELCEPVHHIVSITKHPGMVYCNVVSDSGYSKW
jgi:hypothetical protein